MIHGEVRIYKVNKDGSPQKARVVPKDKLKLLESESWNFPFSSKGKKDLYDPVRNGLQS